MTNFHYQCIEVA